MLEDEPCNIYLNDSKGVINLGINKVKLPPPKHSGSS